MRANTIFAAAVLAMFLPNYCLPAAQDGASPSPSTTPAAASIDKPETAPKPIPAGSSTSDIRSAVPPIVAALAAYRSGKFAEAEAAYTGILKTDPSSSYALVGLARVQLKQQRLHDAEATLAKALAIDPKADHALTAQGELYFRQGRIHDAQDILTELVKKKTPQSRAYWALGNVYWSESNYQHAKLLFDIAHDRDPLDPDIRRRWLFTLTRKEFIKEMKGYLAGDSDDDSEEREHLQTSLVTSEEAEESARQGCRIVGDPSEVHLPLQRLMYGAQSIRGYGLRTEVNGAKATLLVDTGASGLLVSKRFAEKAGIKRIVATDMRGIGDKGTVAGFVGVAESIKFGALELQGCHIRVMDRNSVADEDGLVGADTFARFLVTINFPDQKFDLTPLPAMPPRSDAEKQLIKSDPGTTRFRDRYIDSSMKDFTPIYRFGHDLLIPTSVNDSKPKLFIIDTGSFSDTISPEVAKEVTKVRGEDQIKVKGISGQVNKVFTADDINLRFSHFRQPARDMVAFDTTNISTSTGTEVSGFLGFSMLYQMKLIIDYRDGLVDFGYDPNRFH